MLALIEPQFSVSRRMIYTADDERIGTIYDSGSAWTIRGFHKKVLTRFRSSTNDWVWEQDYVYANGQLVGGDRELAHGGRRHHHLDHLGSVRMTSSDSRTRYAINDYFPFGIEQTPLTQEDTNFGYGRPETMKFTGHERDFIERWNDNSSDYLDYMHARYYNPNWGRFLSVDPGRDWDPKQPQSWNMYAYVRNNPINKVDLTGKWTTAIHEKLIDLAFAGLSNSERYILKNASLRVDSPLTGQFPRTAYQHSMRAKGETVGQAMQNSAAFYNKKISEARTQNADAQAHAGDGSGRSEAMKLASLQSVGEAMHMVADASSPQHKGYQVWAPVADPIVSLQHPSGETKIDPVTQHLVVQQLRAVYGTVYGDEQLQRATTKEQQ
jgi:RHS repeat-associated protein